jgi:hypothetical protein
MIIWWMQYSAHFWFGSDLQKPKPEPRSSATIISLSDERAKRRRPTVRAS